MMLLDRIKNLWYNCLVRTTKNLVDIFLFKNCPVRTERKTVKTMDIQYVFGVGMVIIAVVSSIYIHLRECEINKKHEFIARSSEEYERLRREADQWRMAYEEMRARAESAEATLRVQNMVYGKVKVNEIENLHGRKRTETTMETENVGKRSHR